MRNLLPFEYNIKALAHHLAGWSEYNMASPWVKAHPTSKKIYFILTIPKNIVRSHYWRKNLCTLLPSFWDNQTRTFCDFLTYFSWFLLLLLFYHLKSPFFVVFSLLEEVFLSLLFLQCYHILSIFASIFSSSLLFVWSHTFSFLVCSSHNCILKK